MAISKADKAIEEFNKEITVLALAKLNKDEIADTIAKNVKHNIIKNAEYNLKQNINIGKLILSQLKDENTKTGRNFQGLITEIAQDMIESIRGTQKPE